VYSKAIGMINKIDMFSSAVMQQECALVEKPKPTLWKAAQLLRHTGIQQIRGNYSDYATSKRFCAIGALAHEFGWDGRHGSVVSYMYDLEKELGIDLPIRNQIQILNDRGKSFGEIADWLEAQQNDGTL
jgi:hypothetical protein